MRRTILILIALFSLGVSFAQTNEVMSFNLQEAIEYGYKNHKDLGIAANEMQRAREQMVEARSMGIPQLNAGVDYNYFIKLPTSLIPANFLNPMAPDGEFAEISFGTKNNLTASATLSTLIFDGTYLMALKASKQYIDFAKLNFENQKTVLGNSIKKAYLPPLLIQENVKTIEKNISSLEKLYNETNEMYKAGFVEKLDVDKLALTVDNMRVLKNDLQKNYQLALDALKLQMGFPIDEEIVLKESVESLSGELEEELLSLPIDYAFRTEYQVVDQSIELGELNVQRYKRGYWPSMSGFVNYQQVIQGDDLFNDPISTPTSIAGMSLSIPIFDGLYKKAKIQQAKLDVRNAELQKGLLENAIDFQLKAARKNYFNALEKIKSRKQNLELAESIFNITQEKYKEGVGSSLEIIQAEQSLQDSQQNYLNALYDFIVAKIDVEIALGKK